MIFMTDLDGTLLTDDKRILDKDMAAIERFRAGGGIFTAATGRGYAMARRVAVIFREIRRSRNHCRLKKPRRQAILRRTATAVMPGL